MPSEPFDLDAWEAGIEWAVPGLAYVSRERVDAIVAEVRRLRAVLRAAPHQPYCELDSWRHGEDCPRRGMNLHSNDGCKSVRGERCTCWKAELMRRLGGP